MHHGLKFLCKKCHSLVAVERFERTQDGTHFCRCSECGSKNAVVQTGARLDEAAILPVTRLLEAPRAVP